MATQSDLSLMDVEHRGDVTMVRFTGPMLWGMQTVQAVGDRLFDLVDVSGRKQLLLDLLAVESMDSSMLGKLIALHKKVVTAGGRLVICQFQPELYANFETLKLARLLHIYKDRDEALKSFAAATGE
jgi:stage II sporulation protein AA (anti-sigma F factor antagonist)